jgi:mycothiol synthase
MSDVQAPTVRPLTAADAPAVLGLARAEEERVLGRPSRLDQGDVRDWWQAVDLAADSWLLLDAESSSPTAAAWLDRAGADLAVCFPLVTGDRRAVLPRLVDLVERRADGSGLQRLHVSFMLPDPSAEELLTGRGYREVRRFHEMAIELDAAPATVRLPDGFSLETATVEGAARFHAAVGEAFEDHWEFHPIPFDEWWSRRSGDPDFDITWWFVIREGEETVAAIRNVPARNGGVYVATLGVRRAWRGRGLAKALLQHTFTRSVGAGFRRVTLGVDAASPTGATALYRSVGMTTELESAVWERSRYSAG